MIKGFFQLFGHRPALSGYLFVSLVGIGISQTMLLHSFRGMIRAEGFDMAAVLSFFTSLGIYFIVKRQFYNAASKLAPSFIAQARLKLFHKLKTTALEKIEQIGLSKLLNVLQGDARQVSLLVRSIFDMMELSCSSLFVMLYLLYTSFETGLVFIIAAIALNTLSLIYALIINPRLRNINRYIRVSQSYSLTLGGILKGVKPLKINGALYGDALSHHDEVSFDLRKSTQKKVKAWANSRIFFHEGYYFIAAGMTLATLYFSSWMGPKVELSSLLFGIFFMADMLYGFIISLNDVMKTGIYLENIGKVSKALGKKSKPIPQTPKAVEFKESLELQDLSYSIHQEGRATPFSIGPINLKIQKGETLFVIGGNGSGKSTFLKTITGLYPWEGSILVDGEEIGKESLESYQDMFGVVFADFFLLKKIYRKKLSVSKVNRLIKLFGLSSKTSYDAGGFTNTKLSSGQRKRLALITSLLYDKDIYIFDEAAADQDPENRKFFYEFVLKDIKKAGKTAIIVSHDDNFFHVADRVLLMQNGMIETGAENDDNLLEQ